MDHVVGTSNGTTALQLSLLALGIGPGDEVILPAHTFIATAEAVSHVGARPVLVDVQEDSGNLDPDRLADAVTSRTKAIIPVHLYGQPADLEPILEFGRRRGIPIVEDACQAHGAAYGGSRVGSFGTISCFSFYPGKNLGAYGEAGAIATADPELAARVRRLRDHGQSQRYHHAEVGYNARMEGIQGAVLGVKLRHLDAWNRARAAHAAAYAAALGDCEPLTVPTDRARTEPTSSTSTWSARRIATSFETISRAGESRRGSTIRSRFTFSRRTHRSAFAQGAFPVAESWAGTGLSLPMFPELTPAQVEEVVEGVRSFPLLAAAQANNR